MHNNINQLISIENEIKTKIIGLNYKNYKPNIIAVSKTFAMNQILPLINHGHKHFGENKVQEAVDKWTDIKKDFLDIKLHMIGKLQSNKVKYVIPLFDYIHSLDNLKLAEKIAHQQSKFNKKLKIFIQINIGNEVQKSGVNIEDFESFYKKCVMDLKLNIVGLMCIPPNDNSSIYFSSMKNLLDQFKLSELSMGMSNDYLEACKYKSTFLRIGSKIFGPRIS
ncbi:MAG: YggS family pyridoxal phosphate-dependent enzyme [Candidatus Pelagibacter sp.]|nr:YggS family pyridoxal phosphate-dependent enzyme [Candidatus Pelagibacter sp.]